MNEQLEAAAADHNPSRVLLEAQDLTFAYRANAHPILEGWSAKFLSGTTTALTGPSGRGKSTLLYLLGLMLRPAAGDILVDGRATTGLRDVQNAQIRAGYFGFVFQDAALDPSRTVLDNVTESSLYRGTDRKKAAVRARDLLERFNVGVPPARRPGQVSGGQAQRIALCRALIHEPQILLADEPTGNLDPESSAVVVEGMISHSRTGAAVVIVTHSPEVAAACDREIRL